MAAELLSPLGLAAGEASLPSVGRRSEVDCAVRDTDRRTEVEVSEVEKVLEK